MLRRDDNSRGFVQRNHPSHEATSIRCRIPLPDQCKSNERPSGPRLPPRARDLPGIHTIVVDPGHGGTNSGAISRSGMAEKEITLPIAQSLKEALERAMPVRVLLTRDGDDALELDERSAIANRDVLSESPGE